MNHLTFRYYWHKFKARYMKSDSKSGRKSGRRSAIIKKHDIPDRFRHKNIDIMTLKNKASLEKVSEARRSQTVESMTTSEKGKEMARRQCESPHQRTIREDMDTDRRHQMLKRMSTLHNGQARSTNEDLDDTEEQEPPHLQTEESKKSV